MEALLDPRDRALHRLNKFGQLDEAVEVLCRRAAAARDEAPRSRRRAVRAALDRVLALRRAEARGPAPRAASTEPAAPVSADPLAWAEAHFQGGARSRAAGAVSIRPGWLPADLAVLVTVVLPETVFVFVVARGLVEVTATATTRPRLWDLVHHANESLRAAGSWGESRPALETLGEALGLAEIAARLPPRVRRLVVAPDDVLVHLPFAALPVDGRPLVERASVVLLPRARWGSPGTRGPRRRAVGAAVRRSRAEPGRSPLPGALAEVAALEAARFRRVEMLVDDEATSAAVVRALDEADVIHFACHGEFEPDDPRASGLLLADGWLRVRDLDRQEGAAPSLSVIASCWAGNVVLLPGGEPISLPSALLDRGGRWVVTSLWEVEDEASARFMRAFYARLPRAGPVEALAASQREWSAREAPRAWSGFVAHAAALPTRRLLWPLRALRRS
jgi:CHAT domain-containing protein